MRTGILVVDDEKEIVDILRKVLSEAGYDVTVAYDGKQAIEYLQNGSFGLIVMDVMMPKVNGIEATVRMRQFSNVPILMLSAKTEHTDKCLGLSSGADDYLSKPFYRDELLARVQSLLRRYHQLGCANTEDKKLLRYFDLAFDTRTHKLFVGEREVSLTAKEEKILLLLMSSPGRVFTAEEIYTHCWESDAFAVENTVMVHVSRLRKKIEVNPSKPEYIKVVWGIGYKMEKQ